MSSRPRVFQRTKRVAESTYIIFVVNGEMRAQMEKSGVKVLSRLAQRASCAYEEKLLNSLLAELAPVVCTGFREG